GRRGGRCAARGRDPRTAAGSAARTRDRCEKCSSVHRADVDSLVRGLGTCGGACRTGKVNGRSDGPCGEETPSPRSAATRRCSRDSTDLRDGFAFPKGAESVQAEGPCGGGRAPPCAAASGERCDGCCDGSCPARMTLGAGIGFPERRRTPENS